MTLYTTEPGDPPAVDRAAGTTRLLIVDDDQSVAQTAAAYLEWSGDDVEAVVETTASAGLERLAASRFDCVVSDYEMPGTDGVDFLEAVRETYPDLPFVLFTGKGSEAVAGEAISAGATDYLQKDPGSDQMELLANRVQNAVAQYRATRRAAELDRIRTLASDVSQALVRSTDRAAAEQRVCELLAAADRYRFAWIGERDPDGDHVTARATAGDDAGYLDAVTITADDSPTGQGPAGTALRERRIAVSQDVAADSAFEPWHDDAAERDIGSAAAVPLAYEDDVYGVLVVYADHPHAFDDDERTLLADVGTDVGHALHSFEMRDRLRAERTFVDQAVDALDDIFYAITPDGRLRRWNDRVPEVTGYDDDAIAEMSAVEFFADGDRERIADALAGTLADGQNTVQADLVRADGERVPYEFTGTRLTGPDGEVTGTVGIGRDVTERQRRERALQREQERFSGLFESVPEPVVHVQFRDGEPVVRNVNAAFEEVFGHDAAAVTGSSIDEYVVPEDDTTEAAEINELALDHDTVEREVRRRTADGERTFLFRVVQTDTGHGHQEAVGMYVDITDQKRRERELQRQNERLDRFASVVSHDLQNPLNVADGYLAEVREDVDRPELDAVADALDRMESLVDDVLTLTRTGERVSDVDPVDLGALADGCWDSVATEGATLVVEEDRTVMADSGRLKRLLENLFRNAVEHGSTAARPGTDGRSVTVTVGAMDDGFYVADDGPGIPDGEREAVFDSGYSQAAEGTGLGLAIVREVAQAHGWTVRAAESDDGGARFEVTGVAFAD